MNIDEHASKDNSKNKSEQRSTNPFFDSEETFNTLSKWMSQSTSNDRQSRRYLEEHLELVSSENINAIKGFNSHYQLFLEAQEANGTAGEELYSAGRTLQDHLRLLEEIHYLGGSVIAIREVYVDHYGGFALDIPPWLDAIGAQLFDLDRKEKFEDISMQRVELLRSSITHLQSEPDYPKEVLAELYIQLCQGLRKIPEIIKSFEIREEMIDCLKLTLHIYTPEKYPRRYLNNLVNLGNVYRMSVKGEIGAHIKEAIFCLDRALNSHDVNESPMMHAFILESLGDAYTERLDGEKRANLEVAITYFDKAIEVYIALKRDFEYANLLIKIGNIYTDRIEGHPQENLSKAFYCYALAAPVLDEVRYPEEYANLQLGISRNRNKYYEYETNYQQRAVAIEDSIKASENALRIFTREKFPFEYAMTHEGLGNVNVKRVAGERVENMRRAIDHYKKALAVYNYHDHPLNYAITHYNLGRANYLLAIPEFKKAVSDPDLPVAERDARLRDSVESYHSALKVYSLDLFPSDYRDTQQGLALSETYLGKLDAAHKAYYEAFLAEERLISLGSGIATSNAIFSRQRNSAIRDGFILHRLGRIEEAAVIIERGRARGLAESIMLDTADPIRIRDVARRERYTNARKDFNAAQAILNESLVDLLKEKTNLAVPQSGGITDQELREANLQRITFYRNAKARFDAIVAEIRAAQDPAGFLEDSIEPATLLNIVEQIRSGHALVYLISTPWGGAAVAAISADPAHSSSARFVSVELPQLTDNVVRELIERRTNGSAGQLIGGFMFAQLSTSFPYVISDYNLGENDDVSFRGLFGWVEKTSMLFQDKPSTLKDAMQNTLNVVSQVDIADQPLKDLTAQDRALLVGTLEKEFLSQELHYCLGILEEAIVKPLTKWLVDENVNSVTLIPCGGLAAFPLAAAEVAPNQIMSDIFSIGFAPSARSLQWDRSALVKRKDVYALGDPRPTHQELKWGEAEAYVFVELAKHLGITAEFAVKEQATQDWLLQALQKGYIVNASCHGSFNQMDTLRSTLLLAQNEKLTLAEILSDKVDLRGLRLFILSACQTAILDLQGAQDEVHSLAVGMIEAGAKAVLGSLWSVDDMVTFLLISRFAQLWFPHMRDTSPADALRHAQHWLRTVTNQELQLWSVDTFSTQIAEDFDKALYMETASQATSELRALQHLVVLQRRGYRWTSGDAESYIHLVAEVAERIKPGDRPYADPFYWAGFQIIGY